MQQERVELEYHQAKPESFDELMAGAKAHVSNTVRLPRRLVQTLKTVAETEGEPQYESMVRRWVEERLRQETKRAARSSKKANGRRTAARRQA